MIGLDLADWKQINDILEQVGSSMNLTEFCNNFLWLIRPLIPFDYGHFMFFDQDKKVLPKSHRINIADDIQSSYINYYTNLDSFRKQFLNTGKPLRSTDVMHYQKWEKTEFFNDFMKKHHFYYQAVADVKYQELLLSSISLIRSKKSRDFSIKDILFLKILTPHVANHMYKLIVLEKKKKIKSQQIIQYINKNEDYFSFTDREREVVELAIKGKSNEEIADLLFISPFTVKRHLSTIYQKTQVQNRTELFAKLLQIN